MLLSAQGITLSDGNTRLLSELDVFLAAGALTVLAGPIGSGKSLLSRVLAGLIAPDAGAVEINGRPVRRRGRRTAEEVGIVFQDARAHLLGATVAEDVELGLTRLSREQRSVRRNAVLETCGISRLSDRSVPLLSGGEARLAALASALAPEPELLICDEPFANLDWRGIDRVLRTLLSHVSGGGSVLVVTHEIDKVLAHAESLLVLKDPGNLRRYTPSAAFQSASAHIELEQAGLRLGPSLEDMSWLRSAGAFE